jgi:hypothetical protein
VSARPVREPAQRAPAPAGTSRTRARTSLTQPVEYASKAWQGVKSLALRGEVHQGLCSTSHGFEVGVPPGAARTTAPSLKTPNRKGGCMSESLSTSERDDVPVGRRRRSGRHGAGFVAGAGLAVPPPPPCCAPWCLVVRFTCRHSARVFSSPALHACFAARPPARLSRRSSRRSMPCVCAYAGATTASITMAAHTPTPRRKLATGRMLFSCGAAIVRSTDRAASIDDRRGHREPMRLRA